MLVLDSPDAHFSFSTGKKHAVQQGVLISISQLFANESAGANAGIHLHHGKGLFKIEGQNFFDLNLVRIPQTCEQYKIATDRDPVVFEIPPTIAAVLQAQKLSRASGKGIVIKCVGVKNCDPNGRYLIFIDKSRLASPSWEVCPSTGHTKEH